MFRGTVESGIGIASQHIGDASDELEILLGERPLAGSLNVILDKPLALDRGQALKFGDGRMAWPARLNGKPVWLYRWAACPLHVAEFLSPDHLRSGLNLGDGDAVTIELDRSLIRRAPKLTWALLWKGRETWFRKPLYNKIARRIGIRAGLGLGRIGRYRFKRTAETSEAAKVLNLLNYAKTSGTEYAATRYPAGYHSIEIGGKSLRGQRDPLARLDKVPFDFAGKTVLDIGCNQGGMLFPLADKLKWGVGIDYDPRMVNAANRIRRAKQADNLDFYVFDLDRERFGLIRDFLPGKVDVCFLLSVSMWIGSGPDLLDFAASISDFILFESNGQEPQQEVQLAGLKKVGTVQTLSDASDDDPRQKKRRLYWVTVRPQPVADNSGSSA